MFSLYVLKEGFEEAFKSLWAHKLRSFLTLLGITIGVMTVISLVSVISGLNNAVAESFSSLGAKVLYIERWPWVDHGPPGSGVRYRHITVEEASAIVKLKSVWAWSFRGSQPFDVKWRGNEVSGTVVNGVGWQYPLLSNIDIANGRFFSFGEEKRGSAICVLGAEVANKLFGKSNPIGKWIEFKNEGIKVKVVGVLVAQGRQLFGSTVDDQILIPYSFYRKITGERFVESVIVSAHNPEEVDFLKEEVRTTLRAMRKLKPDQEDNFGINSQEAVMSEYRKATKTLWTALIAIAALSLLVGGIGVMNIMLITVAERTREIGIRKAIGATKSQILAQFLTEAVVQCWCGGILGFAAGIIVPYIAKVIYSKIPVAISFNSVLVAIIFTSIVGITFGIYPALKAAKLSPVEALRYE